MTSKPAPTGAAAPVGETSKCDRPPRRRSGPVKRAKRSKEAPAKRPTLALVDAGDEQDEPDVMTAASDIRARPLPWLLPGLLPLGVIAVLEGHKGAGKSALAATLAAAVSGGAALPGCRRRQPAPVFWFAGEEDVPTMTRPKLAAAGANLAYCWFPGWDGRGRLSRPWLFPTDLGRLQRQLQSTGAKLVILDPLSSFVPPGYSLGTPQEARHLALELARLAGDLGLLLLATRNLSKCRSAPLLHQGLGSIEIANVARSVVRCDLLDQPRGRRVLHRVAGNCSGEPRPLLFDLDVLDGQPRVAWRGSCDPEDELLAGTDDDPAERDAFGDAQRFLADALREGKVPAKDLVRHAEEAGITRATLRRAKKHLGVTSLARGNLAARVWYWQLPRS